MGILGKLLGWDSEKKVDDAAETASWLPGPIGDLGRAIKLGRKGEDEIEKRRK